MSDANQLLPCPFCGSDGIDWPDGTINIDAPVFGCHYCDIWTAHKERWNRRATPVSTGADAKDAAQGAVNPRIVELAHRLISSEPWPASLSMSEKHELSEWVLDVVDTPNMAQPRAMFDEAGKV
jgi:hypothetical protein